MGFAACLSEQGRFSATVIGDFFFLPEVGRHVWNGKIATNMAELAEQVNGAIKSVNQFGDPFQEVEVVKLKEQETIHLPIQAAEPDIEGEIDVAPAKGAAPPKRELRIA